jgi:hypothetical protein
MSVMGMFDWYEPTGAWTCLECGDSLTGFQGKDGPNALLVWREGVSRMAVEQRIDEPFDVLDHYGCLPHRFTFYAYCPNDHFQEFVGECVDGLWSRSVRAAPRKATTR